MPNNSVFNLTVCIIGIAIFLIHIINLLFKKNKRKDEKWLLLFLSFTAFHFALYLTFSLIKTQYTSDTFIKCFYTFFYIFNNVELLLLFLYMLSYIELENRIKKVLLIINYSLFAVFFILDIINVFSGMFFTAKYGEYVRTKTMIFSQGYQFTMLAAVFVISLLNKKLVIREKVAFACYCVLPLIAIILQNAFPGYAIGYASIIIAIEILFFFVNVSKNVQLAIEQEKNKEAQIRIMVSQIQPHFIYNSLSSISTLISIDPDKAQKALDDFTEYLRGNLSSLTEAHLVSFESELKHIQTYVELEKMRFNERLEVKYDIRVSDFNVPCLSIQPIVENAIKHGVLQKIEGGTVILKSYEDNDFYYVEVEDDGVGFDINKIDFDSNKHIGLKNIKYRIEKTCNGVMSIHSQVDKGTKIVVKFKK